MFLPLPLGFRNDPESMNYGWNVKDKTQDNVYDEILSSPAFQKNRQGGQQNSQNNQKYFVIHKYTSILKGL